MFDDRNTNDIVDAMMVMMPVIVVMAVMSAMVTSDRYTAVTAIISR